MELPDIRDVMTTELVTATEDLPVNAALETMRSRQIRRLPVLGESGRLVGIITAADARHALPREATLSGGGEAPIPTVGEVMTRDVLTVRPSDLLDRAAIIMLHHKIGAVPVVQYGKVHGIVTESDVFRWVAGEWDVTGQTRWK